MLDLWCDAYGMERAKDGKGTKGRGGRKEGRGMEFGGFVIGFRGIYGLVVL